MIPNLKGKVLQCSRLGPDSFATVYTPSFNDPTSGNSDCNPRCYALFVAGPAIATAPVTASIFPGAHQPDGVIP